MARKPTTAAVTITTAPAAKAMPRTGRRPRQQRPAEVRPPLCERPGGHSAAPGQKDSGCTRRPGHPYGCTACSASVLCFRWSLFAADGNTDLHLCARRQAPHTGSAAGGRRCGSGVDAVSKIFSFYIGHFWKLSYIYGSLAAIVLITLWLNVNINVLFLGAGLNAKIQGMGQEKKEPDA